MDTYAKSKTTNQNQNRNQSRRQVHQLAVTKTQMNGNNVHN
jgi:hypothetical protein